MMNSRNKIPIDHAEFKLLIMLNSRKIIFRARCRHTLNNVSILMIDATKVMRLFMILLVSLHKN